MLPFPQLLQYGNEIIPDPYVVLFSLKNFNTPADIVDKSGNNIAVSNASAIGVGADEFGTYMNFTGSNTQWLNFNSSIFNIGTNMEIYFRLSQWGNNLGGQYGTAFIDTRPIGVNGNYLITGYKSQDAAPYSTTMNVSLNEVGDSVGKLPTDNTFPIEIRIRCLSTGTYLYVNNVLYNSTSTVINMVNQNYTISKNAFSGSASTPFLKARIYQFEIRKLL